MLITTTTTIMFLLWPRVSLFLSWTMYVCLSTESLLYFVVVSVVVVFLLGRHGGCLLDDPAEMPQL